MAIDNVTKKSIESGNYISEPIKATDFIKESEKKVEKEAVISPSNSIDMSDMVYQNPQKNDEEDTLIDSLNSDSVSSSDNRRNEMIVAASLTTSKDYDTVKEDGYSVIVSETDKIKAVLAKAGVDISIYGDSLTQEQLEEITGSTSTAIMIENQLKSYDVPVTEENIRDIEKVIEQAKEIENITPKTKAYLIKNNIEPTISNIYKATYSSHSSVKDNYVLSDEEIVQLKPQFEKVMEEAGIEFEKEAIDQCVWLVENQIAVTPKNLKYAFVIDGITSSAGKIDESFYAKAAAQSIAVGNTPADAYMTEEYLLFEKAQQAVDIIAHTTDENIEALRKQDKPVTIENLSKIVDTNAPIEGITAHRKLEEARLYMTFEANLSLLKRGISIDIEPIEKVVDMLKAQENEYYNTLFGNKEVIDIDDQVAQYKNVTSVFEEMKTQPAYVIDNEIHKKTVSEIYAYGKSMQASFEKANQTYETLSTAPRADLGDSISKAFINIDDILTDLGLELNDSNKRAVRILGYNNTQITVESVSYIKAADEQMQRAFKNMTPAVTLNMIKKGIFPLELTMQQLNDVAENIKGEISEDSSEKFSEFLWKLEKNDEITKEERDSYIGIYRLISQVEKTDGAVIGSLINQGADITMGNLLSAVRTRSKKDMDFKVDDDFGGIQIKPVGLKIDEQIASAYHKNCMKDIMDEISPEKLRFKDTDEFLDMTPEQLKSYMENTPENEAMSEQYAKEQIEFFKKAVSVSDSVYAFLDRNDVKITATNLMSASRLLKNPSEVIEKLWERGDSAVVRKLLDDTLENFSEAIKNPTELAEAQEKLAETAEHVMESMIIEDKTVEALDIKQLKLLCSQLSVATEMAKEENYIVPVETSDGVTGVNLKIIRDKNKKSFVDIFMQDKQHGKISASFDVEKDGVTGLITVENEETRKLLMGTVVYNMRNTADIRVAVLPEVTAEQFMSQTHNVKNNISDSEKSDKEYSMQTRKLYSIAEAFIKNIKELPGQDNL